MWLWGWCTGSHLQDTFAADIQAAPWVLTSCRLISLAVSTWLTHTSKVSLHSLLSLRFVLEEVAFLDQARGARMSGRLSLRKLMDRYTMRKRNHRVSSRTGWILCEQLPITDRHKSCICKTERAWPKLWRSGTPRRKNRSLFTQHAGGNILCDLDSELQNKTRQARLTCERQLSSTCPVAYFWWASTLHKGNTGG